MLKKFFVLMLLFPLSGIAQQDPYFVTDGFGALWNNPASFGGKNKFAVNGLGRIQWANLSGGPRLVMVNSEYAYDFQNSQLKGLAGKFGTGLNFIGSDIGGWKEQIFQVPLNYQFKIDETYLSLGLSPGFKRIDISDAFWITPQNPQDPALPNLSQTLFQLDVGMYWYGEKFYVGVSSTQFTEPRYDEILFQSRRHYYLMGGYRFSIFDHYFYPQLQLMTDGSGIAFINMNYFQFKDDVFSLGAGFGAGHALFGASFRYQFAKIAYNLGVNTSPLSSFSNFSHELRLTFAWK